MLTTTMALGWAGEYTIKSFEGGDVDVWTPTGSWSDTYHRNGNSYGGQWTARPSNGNPAPMPTAGTVDCAGQIELVFEWQPDEGDPNEPPPNCVVVKNTCTAFWQGDSGSSANGYGFAPTGGTSTGTQWQVVQSPGEEFSVFVSPESDVTCLGDWEMGALSGTAGISYTAIAYPIRIVYSSGIGKQYLRQFLLGEECWATLSAPLSGSGYTWSVIGGKPFADYIVNMTNRTGTLTAFSGSTASALRDCFFAKADTATVSCSAHLTVPSGDKPTAGLDISVSAGATAVAPASTLSGTIESPGVYKIDDGPGSAIKLDKIVFSGSATDPTAFTTAGYSSGEWCYVQIVTLGSTRVVSAITQSEATSWNSQTFQTGLDFGFPYEPSAEEPYSWAADGTARSASDTPLNSTVSGCTQLNVRDDFAMYVMYRPSPPGEIKSKWVPLKKLTWYWQGTLTGSGETWTLSNDAAAATASATCDTHPIWSCISQMTLVWI